MHEIKNIMEMLEESAKSEMDKGVECIDTDEMGKVIDMIKDCSMVLYYYTIYKQMRNTEQWQKYGQQTMFRNEDADIAMMYQNVEKTENDYNVAKKKYTEQNEISKKMRMDKLVDFLDDIEHEIKEATNGMWVEEKQTLKNRITKWLGV
jgi:lipopolysaccharide biosynthesis regulator YciM